VASVLFFSRRHPRDLHQAKIAVPACSATSVNLLRIYLNEEWNVNANFETVDDKHFKAQVETSYLNEFDGFLVIGDKAIEIDAQSEILTVDETAVSSWKYWRQDLAQWWHGRYRVPMVFGVWAAKRNWIIANEDLFQTMCTSLQKALSLGLGEMFEQVLQEAAQRTGFSRELLETYYKKNLNFELSERHLQGLELYRQLCVRHGLL
jgi:chorismate dehydratase